MRDRTARFESERLAAFAGMRLGSLSPETALLELYKLELLADVTDPALWANEWEINCANDFFEREQPLPRGRLFYDLYCRVAQDLRLGDKPAFENVEKRIFVDP